MYYVAFVLNSFRVFCITTDCVFRVRISVCKSRESRKGFLNIYVYLYAIPVGFFVVLRIS